MSFCAAHSCVLILELFGSLVGNSGGLLHYEKYAIICNDVNQQTFLPTCTTWFFPPSVILTKEKQNCVIDEVKLLY
jgi:hypothetical protein